MFIRVCLSIIVSPVSLALSLVISSNRVWLFIRSRESCLLISAFISTNLVMIFKNAHVVSLPELSAFGSNVCDKNDVPFGGVAIWSRNPINESL